MFDRQFDLQNVYRVIDIDKDFTEVSTINFYIDIDDSIYIPTEEYNEEGKVKHIALEDYKGTLVPLYFRQVNYDKIPKVYKRLYKNYREIFRHLIICISINDKISLDDTIIYFREKFKLTDKETSLLIKLAIANKDVVTKKSNSKVEFIASKKNTEIRRKILFLATVLDEVKGKSKRISNLISHSGTVGNYREHLLMNTLNKYLPKKFSISSGFIENIPRQIDIIIYDSHNYIPLFNENGIVVVKKEAVRAVIEVKSKLNKNKLNEALDLLYDVSKTQTIIPIFKGIFAFDTTTNMKTETIAKNIKEFYNKTNSVGIKENSLNYIFQSIDVLCVLDKHLINIAHDNYKGRVIPYISAIKSKYDFRYEGAYFLNKLFKFIDVEASSRRINNEFFWELDNEIEVECLTNIYDDEQWLKLGFRTGGKILKTTDEFNERYENVIQWVEGKMTTNELYKIYE